MAARPNEIVQADNFAPRFGSQQAPRNDGANKPTNARNKNFHKQPNYCLKAILQLDVTLGHARARSNARARFLLPRTVRGGSTYRVGFEQRKWKVGETLIFDDSLEHEARNDSDELRVVLIFDLWNPLLTPVERSMVQAITAATRSFAG